MKTLNTKNIEIITPFLKGKRLEKFLASVNCYQSSLSAGGWLPKMSVSADKGFNAGCGVEIEHSRNGFMSDSELEQARYNVARCLASGYTQPSLYEMKIVAENLTAKDLKKISPEVLVAWCSLSVEKNTARLFLDGLRPLPVLTSIGLSPKVTKTLKDINLDIDLPSVRMAEIAYNVIPKKNHNFKSPNYGEIVMGVSKKAEFCYIEYSPYVKWTKGIAHRQSRFSAVHGKCEACGKSIPSGRFVPIEAMDKKQNRLVSMWLGCDCAKNIFGVKDVGISRELTV